MSQQWHSLLARLGLQPSSAHRHGSSANLEALTLYSAVPTSSEASSPIVTNRLSEMGNDHLGDLTSPSPSPHCRGLFLLPTLSRFLADFTLGFADGLTVPFALTAGLSSLGQADTVIYAGMAEICAGSISMGIGGYLSARGEVTAAASAAAAAAATTTAADGYKSEEDLAIEEEKGVRNDVVADYLDPLELPHELHEAVIRHIRGSPATMEALLERRSGSAELNGEDEASEDERLPSPLMAGLSVALGYLVGGMLPLFPYFLVSHVKDGLVWSFGVCTVALFVFGFCKHLALSGQQPRSGGETGRR
ncbi:c0136039-da26-4ae2-aedc-42cf07a5c265 [Thermothielavioides terrestris]|uniref:C0136039-da26-4ae2-aedc-42cf07a5c265 n=1 Tax=Thermothielavioides terrestris TaxID=2587410 RepID=A0A3S4BIZ2_9PEZI|nr:c0136039-da26-4ae2-aedc-42cf07a5c265 [Thermothielavioides terrestris]